ncbi:MAG: VWA domain-containing protein [Micrococcales bacterium]|nr:VWA domain-containing protein [Micrococcales bacterium]
MATATPAAASFQVPVAPGSGDSGFYNTSSDNPTLPSQCGLDFGLVLDSSGSIGNTGIANLKTAANAFVDSLVDTGSRVAVTSFSTSSPGTGGTNLAPTALTSANLNTIKNSYANLSSNGWTNWQDGLVKMDAFGGWTGSSPDLMVFITDGNPNTTNTSTPGQYNDGAKAAVNPAITIANGMKADGTKMFGIAVGSSISLNPIMAITNQTAYNGSNFPIAGYVQTNDYAALAQQLKELAVDLCAPSLTITKLADTPDTQGFQPANGWTFDTTVTIPGASGKWVTPTTDVIPQNTAITRSAATVNGGAVNFQWEPNGNFPTNPVIVKETLQNGYERDPLLACVARNVIAGTQRNINPTVDGNGNWTLGQIESREIVTCTAKNTLTKLKLTKTVSGGSATPAEFTLTATSPNAPSYSKPGNHPTFEPINGGVVYTLGETGPANYTGGTWSCTNGVNVSNGNQITVPKGTQTECTIANTRDTGRLKLVKKTDPASVNANGWTLTATGPNGAPNVSNLGGQGTLTTVWAGVDYTLAENPNPGANYASSAWTCKDQANATVPVADGKVQVGKGKDVTCEITNTRDAGTLRLVKKTDPASVNPDGWTLSATATTPFDGKNFSNAGGSGTPQSVYAGTPYTLAESPNPGANYTSSVWTCKDGADNPVTVTNSAVTVSKNQAVTCEITNTRDTGSLKLVKKVSGGDKTPADYDLTATATTPFDGKNFTVKGDSDTFKSVFANVDYTLSELPNPGANYTASVWTCKDGANNPVTVTNSAVTVAKNAQVTCEITNTRDLAKLAVVKKVDGGASVPADWKLSAIAAAPNAGKNIVDRAGNITTLAEVYAGTEYTLSEDGPGNYTASNWVCTGTGVTQNGNKVTVAKNGEVTCEITNTRDLAKLAVVKKVDGGASVPADWRLSAIAAAPTPARTSSTGPATSPPWPRSTPAPSTPCPRTGRATTPPATGSAPAPVSPRTATRSPSPRTAKSPARSPTPVTWRSWPW